MNTRDSTKCHLDTTFTQWYKSSFSNPNGNECVEVSFSDNAVGLRDSHNPDGTVLAFHRREWAALLDGIAAAEIV